MASIHLAHPRRRGFFTWEEMSCLARACGFKGDVFERNYINDDGMGDGLSRTQLEVWLDSNQLAKELHRTVNFRTSSLNVLVLKRAARLVSLRKLTFTDVNDGRIAFDLYEEEMDHEGLFLKDLNICVRALKMANRHIAPSQLPTELRRATRSPFTPSRLQLHEFLELMTHCETLVETGPAMAYNADESQRKLFNFRRLLTPADKQKQQELEAKKRWKEVKVRSYPQLQCFVSSRLTVMPMVDNSACQVCHSF